jgi:hypothetical protein
LERRDDRGNGEEATVRTEEKTIDWQELGMERVYQTRRKRKW